MDRTVLTHDAARTLFGSLVGYGLILGLLFVVLFVVPYVAFTVL